LCREIVETIYYKYFQFSVTNPKIYLSSSNHIIKTQELACAWFAWITQACVASIWLQSYGLRMADHISCAVQLSDGFLYALETTWWKIWQPLIWSILFDQKWLAQIHKLQSNIYASKPRATNLTLWDPIDFILTDLAINTADCLPIWQEDLKIVLYTLAIQANNRNADAYLKRWKIYMSLWKYLDAKKDFMVVVAIDPNYPDVLSLIAWCSLSV
jgi:tetratricopeptide (TPR) repeat protein